MSLLDIWCQQDDALRLRNHSAYKVHVVFNVDLTNILENKVFKLIFAIHAKNFNKQFTSGYFKRYQFRCKWLFYDY